MAPGKGPVFPAALVWVAGPLLAILSAEEVGHGPHRHESVHNFVGHYRPGSLVPLHHFRQHLR